MQASQIPVKFQAAFGFGAGPSYIRRIPLLSQIGIQAGAASLTDGFPPVTFSPVGSGGTPPFGADFNGVLNQITLWNVWQAAGSPVAYDSGFSTAIGGYPQGALVAGASSGVVWLCLVDNNLTDPDTGGAGWLGLVTGQPGSAPKLNFFELTAQGTQSIPTAAGNTVTVINDFAVTADQPSDAVFSAGGVITFGPKSAGVWTFDQSWIPSQNTAPPTTVQAYLLKNGANVVNQTVNGTFCTNSGSFRVASGDFVTMGVTQNSGHSQFDVFSSAVPPASSFNLYQISG